MVYIRNFMMHTFPDKKPQQLKFEITSKANATRFNINYFITQALVRSLTSELLCHSAQGSVVLSVDTELEKLVFTWRVERTKGN